MIVGGGGHGLATAYYLAKNHGITNIAVLEKGWLAGGNMARNTTIIRSNYLWDESSGIYEHSLKLWETLDEELDYPILFTQRGVLNLAHSLQDVRDSVRRVNANRLNGIDAEWLDAQQVKELCPIVNISPDIRYPVLGATYQPRAGIAKHDYVAWGYARRANDLGVDLIQNCEVTGIDMVGDRVVGRADHPRPHRRRAGRARARPGTPACWPTWSDCGCPSSPTRCRPWCPSCSNRCTPPWSCPTPCTSTSPRRTRASWSWAPASTRYNGLRPARRVPHHRAADGRGAGAVPDLRPGARAADLGRHRRHLPRRLPDRRAHPVDGLYLNCGWGTGGFKATPGVGSCFAHTIANDSAAPAQRPLHPGAVHHRRPVDEHGAAAVAH